MIGKTMINSLDGDIYGGIYYFTNRSAIDDYFSSDLWVGFDGDKTLTYTRKIYMVLLRFHPFPTVYLYYSQLNKFQFYS